MVTLIGNKSDKHDRRQVSFIEAQTVSNIITMYMLICIGPVNIRVGFFSAKL